MSNKNFDDIIKQKADNHAAPVPADAWDNIAGKKKRKPYPIFWWSLSSLFILGVIFICYHFGKTANSNLSAAQHNDAATLPNNSKNNTVKGSKERHVSTLNNNYLTSTDESDKISVQNKNGNTDRISNDNSKPGVVIAEIQKKNLNKSNNNNIASLQSATTNVSTAETIYPGRKKRLTTKAKLRSSFTPPSPAEDMVSTNTNSSKEQVSTEKNKDEQNEATEKEIRDQPDKYTINKKDTNAIAVEKLKPDSAMKTADIVKTENKTKKQISAPSKKRALILDLSVTPFKPIQHFDQMLNVTRVADNSNIHSVYVADSVHTSLQISTAFGFGIRKNISNKLSIGTALQYALLKENVNLSGIETDTRSTTVQRLATNSLVPYLFNDTIITTTTGTRIINAVNSYVLFSVPLFINYTFVNHSEFSFSFTGGIYFNFAQYHNSIKGELQSVYSNGTQPANNKNTTTEDLFGGLRLSWTVSKKYQFYAEPNFRYNLNKYKLKNSFINKNIDQAGIAVGISYKLK